MTAINNIEDPTIRAEIENLYKQITQLEVTMQELTASVESLRSELEVYNG